MQMTLFAGSRFSYGVLKAQAMLQLVVGRKDQALATFDRMVATWPADRYALASRAHLLVGQGRLDASISCYRQLTCLTARPLKQAIDWFNLGYVLQQAARLEDARLAFEKATELDPAMDRAWYGLALVLMDQQRFLEARKALKKNTRLQPLSPYGWYRLAEVNLALGEPEKARKVIERLRQFEPRVAAQLERECGLNSRSNKVADAAC